MTWGNPIAPPIEEAPRGTPEWVAKVGHGSPAWEQYRDELGAKWEASKERLTAAKEAEMDLRKQFADFMLPPEGRKSGVNNVELPGGYVAKITHKINYKVAAPRTVIEDAEEIAATIGNEGTFLFERIIPIKYDFSVGEYNKLQPELETHRKMKELIDTLIERSDGAPALEIKAPKAPK
jgi:hypothetical protein